MNYFYLQQLFFDNFLKYVRGFVFKFMELVDEY